MIMRVTILMRVMRVTMMRMRMPICTYAHVYTYMHAHTYTAYVRQSITPLYVLPRCPVWVPRPPHPYCGVGEFKNEVLEGFGTKGGVGGTFNKGNIHPK